MIYIIILSSLMYHAGMMSIASTVFPLSLRPLLPDGPITLLECDLTWESTLESMWDSTRGSTPSSKEFFIKDRWQRGGYDHSKLDLKNKLLMNLLRMKILMKNKKKRTPEEVGMLAAFKHPLDAARKDNIKLLIELALTR